MKMVEINWNPEDRILRQFGWLTLVALPCAGWMLMHRPNPLHLDARQQTILLILVGIGVAAAVVGMFRPRLLKWVFVGACLIALPIGMVVSEVMMLAIYFGVFLPVAVVFRLIGRDALERQIDRKRTTYWQPKEISGKADSYFRQS
jgi:hypothetical protein